MMNGLKILKIIGECFWRVAWVSENINFLSDNFNIEFFQDLEETDADILDLETNDDLDECNVLEEEWFFRGRWGWIKYRTFYRFY